MKGKEWGYSYAIKAEDNTVIVTFDAYLFREAGYPVDEWKKQAGQKPMFVKLDPAAIVVAMPAATKSGKSYWKMKGG